MTWLSGCATLGSSSEPAPAVVVTPDLTTYSEAWEQRLADELEANPLPPCHPQHGGPECSAAKAAILDYGDLRRRVRAINGESAP